MEPQMTLTFETKNNVIVEASLHILKYSETLRRLRTRMLRSPDEFDGMIIRYHFVDALILQRILDWVAYHNEHPYSISAHGSGDGLATQRTDWDAIFLRANLKHVFNIMVMAKYLKINVLRTFADNYIYRLIDDEAYEELVEVFLGASLEDIQTPIEEEDELNNVPAAAAAAADDHLILYSSILQVNTEENVQDHHPEDVNVDDGVRVHDIPEFLRNILLDDDEEEISEITESFEGDFEMLSYDTESFLNDLIEFIAIDSESDEIANERILLLLGFTVHRS